GRGGGGGGRGGRGAGGGERPRAAARERRRRPGGGGDGDQHEGHERLDQRAARRYCRRTRPRWFTTTLFARPLAPTVTVPFSAAPVDPKRTRRRTGRLVKRTGDGSVLVVRTRPSGPRMPHVPVASSKNASSAMPSAIARLRVARSVCASVRALAETCIAAASVVNPACAVVATTSASMSVTSTSISVNPDRP